MKKTKKKILIVDDNPDNIKILANILNIDNFKLAFANSGKETLKILDKNSFDLILLDVMMPEMDGYELCERLKKTPKTKDIPIIFITAKDQTEDEKKGLKLGAVDYITKPIEPSITLARVKTHLELSSLRKDLEQKVEEETQKRLKQQKLLIRQSRLAAMGEMMNAITHQWKQPLGIMLLVNGNLQYELEKKDLNHNKLNEYAQHINKTVRFLSNTIDDFKNYFNTDKEKVYFNVKNEIELITNILAIELKKSKITLNLDMDKNLCAYGVPSEFKHVILNLISNAKDAIIQNNTKQRQINIKASKFKNDSIKIEIQDTGGGIIEDVIDMIFDDYFTTKAGKGTGIGLSMSKLIIEEEMQGKISVENQKDGALFIVEIPTSDC